MRFTVALLPDHHEQLPAEHIGPAITEVAVAAERAGVDAVFVTDHPAPDTRWLAGGGHQAFEPTVALTMAAAATSTIRLHTHVYVLAYRNPFLAARALASVDVVSGGRLIVGIAAGYLRPEFAALGVPFEERNERTDAALEVVTRLWAGEEVAGEGFGWSAHGVVQAPGPISRPGPPLWIGGNSTGAMRRAARSGDGWSPFPTPAGMSRAAKTAEIADLATLAARIERFRGLCDDAGRAAPLDICMGAFSLPRYLGGTATAEELRDELGRLAELGVTWTAVPIAGSSVPATLDRLQRLAEEIIGPPTRP